MVWTALFAYILFYYDAIFIYYHIHDLRKLVIGNLRFRLLYRFSFIFQCVQEFLFDLISNLRMF